MAGLKRLAQRAERLGEPGTASLLSVIAAIVLLSLEDLAAAELRPVIEVLEMARSLEAGTGRLHRGRTGNGNR